MKRSLAALAAAVAAVAALVITGVVSAHAPITYIHWDNESNPSSLIAATNNREMVAEPGSFYLRVYDAGGSRVDNGTAVMAPDRLEIHVGLQPDLAPGTYRVDWLTTSIDGAVLSGSESVPLPGSFGSPPSAVPEEHDDAAGEHDAGTADETAPDAVAPPATGDAGLAAEPGGSNYATAVAVMAAALLASGTAVFAHRRVS